MSKYRVVRNDRPHDPHTGSVILCRYATVEECRAFVDGLHSAHGDWEPARTYPLPIGRCGVYGWCLTYERSTLPSQIVWIEEAL